MNWKEEVIGRVHRKDLMIAKFEERAEKANIEGDSVREKKMYARADMAEQYVEGVIDVLEAMGYTIKFDGNHSVKEIVGEISHQYRVRYETSDGFLNAMVCHNGIEVQDVIDRAKEVGYSVIGIDERYLSPNDDSDISTGWNKLFNF